MPHFKSRIIVFLVQCQRVNENKQRSNSSGQCYTQHLTGTIVLCFDQKYMRIDTHTPLKFDLRMLWNSLLFGVIFSFWYFLAIIYKNSNNILLDDIFSSLFLTLRLSIAKGTMQFIAEMLLIFGMPSVLHCKAVVVVWERGSVCDDVNR